MAIYTKENETGAVSRHLASLKPDSPVSDFSLLLTVRGFFITSNVIILIAKSYKSEQL